MGNQKIWGRAAYRLALVVTLLQAVERVSAQTQGLDLSVHRDLIDMGDHRSVCQITCEATGNAVTLETVAIMWINLKVQASNVHTVNKDGKNRGSFSLDGLTGNGTGDVSNNNGYIILDQMDLATCESDQFLCEATYTGPSGVQEKAFAASRPQRPHNAKPDVIASNNTQEAAVLEKRVEDMSSALESLNASYTKLLMDRKRDQDEKAKLLARLRSLEMNVSFSNSSSLQSCDPCSNLSLAADRLKDRLEQLDKINMTQQQNQSGDPPVEIDCQKTCVRGMNETCPKPFYIVSHDVLGRDIRCDAQTDGGGWIVFQRRFDGSVDFMRTWSGYRDGFGDVSTELWLGNEALYNLTNTNSYEMRLEVRITNGPRLYNKYSSFRVESESSNYRLRVGSKVEGTLPENSNGGLAYHNNQPFSTPDRDNDQSSTNCASSTLNGPFWNDNCSHFNPNAQWASIKWSPNDGTRVRNLDYTEMKIRLV